MPQLTLPITDVLVVADCWQGEPEAETLVQRAMAAAAQAIEAELAGAEISVMLTDDAGMRSLNSTWRRIDRPTNVLSFPAIQPANVGRRKNAPRILGDIAIGYQTARNEADQEHKPFAHHLSHLVVHGFLHLIGFDHEKDEQAQTMEALERTILARLGIPDPYADRERMD